MTKLENARISGNLMTAGFIAVALGVFVYGFPFDNIWTVFTGMAIWLLAVANATITGLVCKLIEKED